MAEEMGSQRLDGLKDQRLQMENSHHTVLSACVCFPGHGACVGVRMLWHEEVRSLGGSLSSASAGLISGGSSGWGLGQLKGSLLSISLTSAGFRST